MSKAVYINFAKDDFPNWEALLKYMKNRFGPKYSYHWHWI